MKILIIHNKYGKHSGEETVVYFQIKLLEEAGHKVVTYFRSSEELETMFLGKLKALIFSIFNPKSFRDLKKIIKAEQPDLIHIHNLYPLISPSVLPYLKTFKLPIIMTVHNYRLLCPNGLFFTKNKICEKCTGKGKELNAIINNCEKSIFKSFGYAARNFTARLFKFYTKNVDYFLCLTEFQKIKLIKNGFDESKVLVINNVCEQVEVTANTQIGNQYIGYVGRISEEKGISTILSVAKQMPNVNFKLAGSVHPKYKHIKDKYKNVQLLGFLSNDELLSFYKNSKFIIFPSICYETFGLSLVEAMSQKCAIIASDIAGVPEIVEHDKTGLLFKPGNTEDLRKKILYLLEHPQIADKMGKKGYKKLNDKFRSQHYYKNLIEAYNKAML
ncbi:glycosyltransferase family 4 protein [Gelatiniphilus marinus]|uniref:Glycosyltransferase family 4 protein n=1 Tax=Gelatiniphilus marinus TaxID=1759464 RepID=A0ABW5JW84_9FLAO